MPVPSDTRRAAPTANGVQSPQRRNSDSKQEAFERAVSEVHLAGFTPEMMLAGEPRAIGAWLDILQERVSRDMLELTGARGMRPLDAVQTLVVGVALTAFKVGRRYQQLLTEVKRVPRAAQRKDR